MLCHVSDVVGVMDRAEDVGRAGERGRGSIWEGCSSFSLPTLHTSCGRQVTQTSLEIQIRNIFTPLDQSRKKTEAKT